MHHLLFVEVADEAAATERNCSLSAVRVKPPAVLRSVRERVKCELGRGMDEAGQEGVKKFASPLTPEDLRGSVNRYAARYFNRDIFVLDIIG